jgi:hypothetical protein
VRLLDRVRSNATERGADTPEDRGQRAEGRGQRAEGGTADATDSGADIPEGGTRDEGRGGRDTTDGEAVLPASQGSTIAPARRAAPPQDAAEMTALREVANVAARTAIAHHGRRRLLRLSSAKMLVTLLAIVCGVAMIWMWRFFEAGDATFYGGLACLLVAVFWGVQYAVLTGKLIVNRSGHLQWKSPRRGPDAESIRPAQGAQSTKSEIRNPK